MAEYSGTDHFPSPLPDLKDPNLNPDRTGYDDIDNADPHHQINPAFAKLDSNWQTNTRSLSVEQDGVTEYNTVFWDGDQVDPLPSSIPIKSQRMLSKLRQPSSISYVDSNGETKTIGQHTLQKVPVMSREGHPTAQLVLRVPHVGSSYIGFLIRLTRGEIAGLKTRACLETPCVCGVCDIHKIEFRFTCGTFKMFSRPGTDNECFVTFQKIHNQKSWIIGLEDMSNADQWTLGFRYTEPQEKEEGWAPPAIRYCRTAAQIFATIGHGRQEDIFHSFLMPTSNTAFTVWNPVVNAKFDPDGDQLGPHHDRYERMHNFESWEDYCVFNAYGLISDTRWTLKYLELFRAGGFMTQLIFVPDQKNAFYASFFMTEKSANSHKILDVGDEVEIMTYPFTPGLDANGNPLKDGEGWKAAVINPDEIEHSGTHLLRFDMYSESLSSYRIYKKYEPKGYTYAFYFKLLNSVKPTKYKLKSLTAMHPKAKHASLKPRPRFGDGDDANDHPSTTDLLQSHGVDDITGADELANDHPANDVFSPEEHTVATWKNQNIDYSINRSILMGNSISDMWYWNLFEGCPPEKLDVILSNCTPKQRAAIEAFGHQIPCGLLFIKGPPCSGKTVGLVATIEIVLSSGKKVLAAAAQNTAVNNLFDRTVSSMAKLNLNKDILAIRLWSKSIEYNKIPVVAKLIFRTKRNSI
ncbi:uncharacterized protein Bfra_004804 [Botrytis fragariae]|uniref:DNA2/NAM7 helicase helicase domain-containing protein n=1 Tax=Botrytis fragariae TaxID=1964551 RepID=A0A8H6EIC8_9HELO|nr:uncharacterized protein Bfra_004804 [Botrytis fragariae]KAF5873347.1 hypothetical protein Bfra_004804 [Botrytis fragariae]